MTGSLPPRGIGYCVWLTGLSGAGKSTTAEAVARLLAGRGRRVTLLDGDVVRRHLSQGLGFSREDRNTNVRRIGNAAASAVRQGDAVVVAVISPYRDTREEVRGLIDGRRFVEVFVDTPLAVCQQRDPKGLYARARLGHLKGLTGVDDPYEPPVAPEIVLDTMANSADENARLILDYLVAHVG